MRALPALAVMFLLAGCVQFGDDGDDGGDDAERSTLDGTLKAGRTQSDVDDLHDAVWAHSRDVDISIYNENLHIARLKDCDLVRADLLPKPYVVSLKACVVEE